LCGLSSKKWPDKRLNFVSANLTNLDIQSMLRDDEVITARTGSVGVEYVVLAKKPKHAVKLQEAAE